MANLTYFGITTGFTEQRMKELFIKLFIFSFDQSNIFHGYFILWFKEIAQEVAQYLILCMFKIIISLSNKNISLDK